MTEKTERAVDGREIALPSGKIAVVCRGTGRHMRLAGRAVSNPAADPIGYSFALIAARTTIDGHPLAPEDIDDMDEADVVALLQELPGNSQPPVISSMSPPSPAGASPNSKA